MSGFCSAHQHWEPGCELCAPLSEKELAHYGEVLNKPFDGTLLPAHAMRRLWASANFWFERLQALQEKQEQEKAKFILRYVPHVVYQVEEVRTGQKQWINIQRPDMLMDLDRLLWGEPL